MEYEQQKRVIYSKISEDMMKFGVRSLFLRMEYLKIVILFMKSVEIPESIYVGLRRFVSTETTSSPRDLTHEMTAKYLFASGFIHNRYMFEIQSFC